MSESLTWNREGEKGKPLKQEHRGRPRKFRREGLRPYNEADQNAIGRASKKTKPEKLTHKFSYKENKGVIHIHCGGSLHPPADFQQKHRPQGVRVLPMADQIHPKA